jgi:CubicO group peptidase (beta-lactamase class C family)
MDDTQIGGDVAPGFGAVADAFRRNFSEYGELGAAFAAYQGDRKVVDLWGGLADRNSGAPWREDTLQVVFSGTKGLSAGCMLLLIGDGLLDPDARVCDCWPEFGAQGKSRITVAELLSHRAGLAGVRTPLAAEDILDGVRMAEVLADQAPNWPNDERLAYHALTFGWLCDGLTRRIANRSIGELFRERIAEPLGLEAWIGLPPEHEPRVSQLDMESFETNFEPRCDPEYAALILGNPPLFARPPIWNRRAFHAAEIPAAGGIAAARSMARFYACLSCGGALDGRRIWSEEAITAGRREQSRGLDAFLGMPSAFGLGFELQAEPMFMGPMTDAFGHCGAGGSAHGAWPEQHVGFSYCMNEMREEESDRRARRLLTALADAIDA